jgi:cell division septation protein DedD
MVSPTPDDGFHEIQLNGKQLVFLFMAATVVSVVIFLCGVLVGRGVRTERAVAQAAALNEAPAPDVLPSVSASAPPTIQADADPRMAAPPAPVDEKSTGVTEDIRPDSAKAAGAARAAAAEKEPPAPAPMPAKSEKSEKHAKPEGSGNAEKIARAEKSPERLNQSSKPTAEPIAATASTKESTAAPAFTQTPAAGTAGDGYAVQVAAVNVRSDADAIAKRFNSKGYSAYVEVPPNGTGTVFRVRIGTFKTKHEAETIAAKLQKEEQIKPWVTR